MSNDAVRAPSIPPRIDLRRRVLAGEPTIGLFLNLGSLVSAQIVARAGYDWAWSTSRPDGDESAARPAVAIHQHRRATSRVMSAERMRVGRILDLGADGVRWGRDRGSAA